MEEQVGCFRVEVPESVSGAPERVLLVNPLALLFILLKRNESLEFIVRADRIEIIAPSI